MAIRKNVKDLTNSEKSAFVQAIKTLKSDGRYDLYVLRHAQAPMANIHRCPAFLPWHRQFLLDLEHEIQTVSGNPNMGIPYWNWAEDQASGSPENGPVWAHDFMGGDGDPNDGYKVKTGPFRASEWTIINSTGADAGPLIRRFGVGTPSLSTHADVQEALNITVYDQIPWSTGSNPSHRNRLEGWYGETGPGLHNRGHVWVGGSMSPMTSPNDPVFFLHHCFVDKIWADWQKKHPSSLYQPQNGGVQGQNYHDFMEPTVSGTITPANVWNIDDLGYSYAEAVQPQLAVRNFGYVAGGWRENKHPRMMADVTGDKKTDIIGFGNAGVYVSINNGDKSFQPPVRAVNNFGYSAGGWRVEKHPRMLADINGDGLADIIGFGNAGVYVSLSNGGGTFQPIQRVINNFGYNAGGWRVDKHPRMMADTTGDGCDDVVGFGNAGVYVATSKGDGTFNPPIRGVNNFGYNAGGWRIDKHPRKMADTTGDGQADIIGFGNAGVYIANSNGDGSFSTPRRVIDNFGYAAGGWRVDKHPRFVADLNGNGRADIIGFGNAGVYVALNNGNGTFTAPRRVVNNFGYQAGGWRVDKHPRFIADTTGDGTQDIVGFGNAGVYVSLNNGDGTFQAPELVVNNFGYQAGGWRVGMHPRTMSDVMGHVAEGIVGFGNAGVYVVYELFPHLNTETSAAPERELELV